MSYQWPLDPSTLFEERSAQMLNLGIPADAVEQLSSAIADMWSEGAGGWVFEWSRLAEEFVSQSRHDLAALAYGWAKFPVMATPAMREALDRQVEQYQLASPSFPVNLERKILDLPFGSDTARVPVHILATPDLPTDAPVLLASGGVDSWKMDLHPSFVAFAEHARVRVMAFDIPGTGESEVALSAESGEIVDGLVAAARELTSRGVGHLGISMGGYFSARTGLTGLVDAAVVLGGPVDRAYAPERTWQFGMADIVGNAVGFDHQPTAAELSERTSTLSLRHLLDQPENSPMLVVNGADDVHIPQHDTLVFEGRTATQVELIPDTGHCAVTKMGEVLPKMIGWVAQALA